MGAALSIQSCATLFPPIPPTPNKINKMSSTQVESLVRGKNRIYKGVWDIGDDYHSLDLSSGHYSLVVSRDDFTWHFFNSAHEQESGKALKVELIERSQSLNKYRELFSVPLTKEYLISKSDTGFSVVLTPEYGERETINVPASYVKAFLKLKG